MFDVQMEFGILRSRLRDVLALGCLDSELLEEACTDHGYINAIIDYGIIPDSEVFESLEDAITTYEEACLTC